jgi:hypothetical protein
VSRKTQAAVEGRATKSSGKKKEKKEKKKKKDAHRHQNPIPHLP